MRSICLKSDLEVSLLNLTERIKQMALEHVDLVGVSDAQKYDAVPSGKKPGDLLPGARSVVVVAHELNRSLTAPLSVSKQTGEVTTRKVYDGHLDATNKALNLVTHVVGRFLGKQGYKWMALPTDGITDAGTLSGLFSFKHAAVLSGLGRFGRHSLVLTPQHGPRQRFAVLLTDAELEPDPELSQPDPCAGCHVCLDVCPPKVLFEASAGRPYAIDRFQCQAFNAGSGGCGLCLARCPAGL